MIICINKKAFTIIEVMVVVMVIGILLSFFSIDILSFWKDSKESLAKTQLHTLRKIIHRFSNDIGRYPEDFNELIRYGYIKKMPLNPINQKTDWQVRAVGRDPLTDSNWNFYTDDKGKIYFQNRDIGPPYPSPNTTLWYTNNYRIFDIRIPDELDPDEEIDNRWKKMPVD